MINRTTLFYFQGIIDCKKLLIMPKTPPCSAQNRCSVISVAHQLSDEVFHFDCDSENTLTSSMNAFLASAISLISCEVVGIEQLLSL